MSKRATQSSSESPPKSAGASSRSKAIDRKRGRKKGKTNGKADDAEALSFEGALEQLETTVGRLEEGEMPLEEALELFEKGIGLSRQCTQTLEAAEKRIEILIADREGETAQFASAEDAADAWDDSEEEDEDFDE